MAIGEQTPIPETCCYQNSNSCRALPAIARRACAHILATHSPSCSTTLLPAIPRTVQTSARRSTECVVSVDEASRDYMFMVAICTPGPEGNTWKAVRPTNRNKCSGYPVSDGLRNWRYNLGQGSRSLQTPLYFSLLKLWLRVTEHIFVVTTWTGALLSATG
jgi:hypothetical protein